MPSRPGPHPRDIALVLRLRGLSWPWRGSPRRPERPSQSAGEVGSQRKRAGAFLDGFVSGPTSDQSQQADVVRGVGAEVDGGTEHARCHE